VTPGPRKGSSTQAGPSDEELVGSVLSGDTAAVMLLIRRYDQLLYRTARSILRDDAEAEDAVQEGYVLAYKSLARFRREAKLSTWLVRIVANVALGRLRKTKQARRVQLDDRTLRKLQERANDLPEPPDEALIRRDVRRVLEAGIDALPDPYRAVFVLRAVQELSVEETAEALCIPNATVRSRFSRGRRLLRKALSKHVDIALGDVFPFAGRRCDRMVKAVMSQLRRAHPRVFAK
jgi:RNA polymerase sigma-70 factor, ECF subfamily